MISRRHMLAGVALAPSLLEGCNRRAGKRVDLFIQSDGDFMAFKPAELRVQTGADVRLTFHHAGAILSQKHDWVLVKPGTLKAVDQDALEAGEGNWHPEKDPRVIAATPLIGKGGTVTIEFTAPEPGDYPFFCSTPGHAEDMQGILHVTAN